MEIATPVCGLVRNDTNKKPHTEDPMCVVSNPHLSFAAGFSTLNEQVAGFHRAVPSTTLDKANMQFGYIVIDFPQMSTPSSILFRNFSGINIDFIVFLRVIKNLPQLEAAAFLNGAGISGVVVDQ